jgi:hypothetical protein
LKKIIATICLLLVGSIAQAQYVGFGSATSGAASCPTTPETYHVTNLSDAGVGSYRDALSQDCRNIVFDVAGQINLNSFLIIESSYITVNGSSAPSPGITINSGSQRVAIQPNGAEAHDLIFHNLRLVGPGGDQEAIDLLELDGMDGPVYNVILDHITFIGGADSAFDIYGDVKDVTLSYNFAFDMIKPMHFSLNSEVRQNITMYGNVFARNNERQVRMRYNNVNIDIVNNVIYGWGYYEGGDSGLDIPSDPGYNASVNVENNIYYYVLGNGSPDNAILFNSGTFPGSVYFANNTVPAGENDNVSSGPRAVIPPYAQVPHLATNELAAQVVDCVGTQYRTSTETNLINEIKSEIGGVSGSCGTAIIRPNPPIIN